MQPGTHHGLYGWEWPVDQQWCSAGRYGLGMLLKSRSHTGCCAVSQVTHSHTRSQLCDPQSPGISESQRMGRPNKSWCWDVVEATPPQIHALKLNHHCDRRWGLWQMTESQVPSPPSHKVTTAGCHLEHALTSLQCLGNTSLLLITSVFIN